MGMLIYKQGILFQGGPADIFTRRIVLPETCDPVNPVEGCFDPAVDNPFAYENVECVSQDDDGVVTAFDRLYPDGVNPNYVLGLCPVDGMNVSGTTLMRCSDGSSGETCADLFPYNSTYEEWFSDDSTIQIPKILQWSQTVDNLNDATWENPYDVSKGHRGFIDGDFIMMMYATAANWKANTTGNEAYQLYIRRSFNGGLTWTTMPDSFAHINGITYVGAGTETCEWYGGYGEDDYSVCTTYGAGEFEPGRNVSQLAGTKITVLDPRYSPTGGMLKKDYTKLLCYEETDGVGDWTDSCEYTEAPYPEDIRDPSAFFATFETGDNTVVTEETATVPLDMYYSRASNFGDDWDEQDICTVDPLESWYPSSSIVCEDGEVELRWDWLENGDDLATEASVYGNSNGDRFYAVWNQELPIGIDEHGEDIFTNMDSQFRRIFYNFTTDAAPTASIMYASANILDQSAGDVLVLVGTGRDWDRLGDGQQIINYNWFDDKGSIFCKIDDYDEDTGEPIYECEKETEIKAADMDPGKHVIKFAAQDNESNWSLASEIEVFVFEQIAGRVYIPFMSR
jgi:hypothetical protein